MTPRTQFIDLLITPAHLDGDCKTCHICRESISIDDSDEGLVERAVCLHDNHIFGRECIRKWLEEHNTCPLCREKLFPDEERAPLNPAQVTHGLPTGPSDYHANQDIRLLAQTYEAATEISENSDYWLTELIARLRRRVRDYAARRLSMDMVYRPRTREQASAMDSSGTEVEEGWQDMRAEEPEYTLTATDMCTALWSWFWNQARQPYLSSPDRVYDQEYCVYQHPLASALLFQTLDALKYWHGNTNSTSMLEWKLQVRWSYFEAREFSEERFSRPDGWEEFKVEMTKALQLALEGEAKIAVRVDQYRALF